MNGLIHSTLFASVLALSLSTAVVAQDAPSPATTQPAPTTAAPAMSGKKHAANDGLDMKFLKSNLKISPEEVTQLKPLFAAKTTDLQAWDDANGQKLADAKGDFQTAKSSGDKPGARAAMKEMRQLSAARDAVIAKDDGAIKAALTPEQQKQLASVLLYHYELAKLPKIQLTKDQKAQIRALCDKQADAATGDVSPKDLESIHRELNKSVMTDVLTPDQKLELKSKRSSRGSGNAGGDASEN